MSHDIPKELDRILPLVQGPGQYVGGEPNIVVKSEEETDLRFALAFPDVYEVGMSHLGARILYDILNSINGIAGERVYAPFPDMEKQLRENEIPLMTLETFTPLKQCEVIGFSVAYELGATSMLLMLDLGRVPLTRFERKDGDPIVVAGGHATYNPEPLSDFVDVFLIGEGEESVPALARIVREEGGFNANREALLLRIAREVEGAYVPQFYRTEANSDGFETITGTDYDLSMPVSKAVIHDFANCSIPTAPLVPVFQTVHERITLEIMRGCPNGCRFCQAGMICRPLRARPVEELVRAAKRIYENTGYDEVGLLSLSTSDYPDFDRMIEDMDKAFAPLGVSLSLPSLRVDHALSDIPKRFKSVRKSGLTFAPEAGSNRLRAVINKDVTNDNLLAATEEAFKQGWQGVKFYFMAGLPTETEDDLVEMAELANRCARLRRKKAKRHAITLSLSNFVPKPHTPFQWEAMDGAESFVEKHRIVADRIDRKNVSFKAHDVKTSMLEGILSRGDRKLGKVILTAYKAGARLDGWSEYFRFDIWEKAFAEENVEMADYTIRSRNVEELLPWSHIDSGILNAFFLSELEKAKTASRTTKCSDDNCAGCGVFGCTFAK